MPRDTQSFAAAAQRYLQSDQFRQDVGSKYNDATVLLIMAGILCLCVIGIPLAIALLIWKWPVMQRSWKYKAEWQTTAGAVPIRTYPVMMNAEFLRGDMTAGPGMVIGSFDDDPALSADVMLQLATELHAIYANGPTSAAQQPVCDMLRDDTYQTDRRRLLPLDYTRGKRIYIFDLWFDNDWLPAGKTHMACLPCIAKPGDEGPIMIVPVNFAGDQEFFWAPAA
jgi:hypothetical protein